MHLAIGEEAVHVGAVVGFGKGDLFCPYREHVLALARGIDPKLIMAELFGKATGVSKGKGGSMHLYEPKMDFYGGNAIVAAHLPHAVGAAYARKLMGEKAGLLCIFGDGATNNGTFFEAINMASLWEVPVLFLCEISLLTTSLFSELNLDMLSRLCLPHPTLGETLFLRIF